MRCQACSADNPSDNTFCETCGARLGSACPHCGRAVPVHAQYCGACGGLLAAATGERKHATVMFADVVGSTTLIADLSAEKAMERLQPAIAVMCAAVRQYDGTVVRTLGDGVLALFGAPRAQEGHAQLACEAALLMQSGFVGSPDGLTIRVGLHSGEVVASVLPGESLEEQGAYGFAIHVANRLQLLAEPGGICLTEECYRLVQGAYTARPLGRQAVKGLPAPIDVYVLDGRHPSGPAVVQSRVTFRGRAVEMAALVGALSDARDRMAPVVTIVGSPGVGKSRLCWEFVEHCRTEGIPVRQIRAQLYGHATPLQAALDFLRLLFGVSPLDDPHGARMSIAARLRETTPEHGGDLSVVADFLGVSAPGEDGPTLPPRIRHERLLDIVRRMIRHDGASPSVILVEDVHWLDEASRAFIATLAEAVQDTQALLVMSHRSDFGPSFTGSPIVREVVLRELEVADTDALVREILGTEGSLEELRRSVVDRSAGNPFFAQELVRSLAENGLVTGVAGSYARGRADGDPALPATAEAVISARIDRLGDVEKAALQFAAVIGQEAPRAVVAELAHLPGSRLDSALGVLSRAELIRERLDGEVWTCVFCHPLIQEVTYATLLVARRRALHALVAEAMERFYCDRPNEFAALIGYHYEAAGRRLVAAQFNARAARWVGGTNPSQAIKHWHRVRSLLRDEPETDGSDQLRMEANGQIAWLGWREGMTAPAARPFIEEAISVARRSDASMVPMLLFVEGRIIIASGGPADLYVQRVREALSLTDPSADAGRTATLTTALCHALGWAGLLGEALERNEEANALLNREGAPDNTFLGFDAEHWSEGLRGRILLRLGRLDDARQSFDRMVSRNYVDPTVQFIPHFGYLELASHLDELDLAEEHATHVETLAARHGSAYLRVFATVGRAIVRGMGGERHEAIEAFRTGLALSRRASVALEAEPDILAHLADCHLRNGAYADAETIARGAIALAQHRSARIAECRASIICGMALRGSDDAAQGRQALRFFRRARELVGISGARLYEPLLDRGFPPPLRSAGA